MHKKQSDYTGWLEESFCILLIPSKETEKNWFYNLLFKNHRQFIFEKNQLSD